ncbi:hypothetical protein [Streptomyces sp. NPDC059398]|uniref:hypothetical protein n=1 Tax=Streptomyces sp. NPDC059398 TaxID=3346820 RepID=UPI0036C22C89
MTADDGRTGRTDAGGGGAGPEEPLREAELRVIGPRPSWLLSLLAVAAGVPLRLSLFAFYLARHLHHTLFRQGSWGEASFAAALLLPVPVYYLTAAVRRAGRRRLARPADAEPPDGPYVLYLRGFTEDAGRARLAPAVRTVLGGPGRSPLSEEEQLARSVRFIGPLIAVARPGARLHHAGARRATMPADDWHGPVLRLMREAALVLLSTGGGGAGLRWELCQALTRMPRRRLLLLIPHGAEVYAELSKTLLSEGWLTAPLPDYPPLAARRARVLPYRGAVGFGADGAAHFVRFDPRWPHLGKPLRWAMTGALLTVSPGAPRADGER